MSILKNQNHVLEIFSDSLLIPEYYQGPSIKIFRVKKATTALTKKAIITFCMYESMKSEKCLTVSGVQMFTDNNENDLIPGFLHPGYLLLQ